MEYDYKSAADRIAELRCKIIAQKDGKAVEGLSALPRNNKKSDYRRSKKTVQTQEMN